MSKSKTSTFLLELPLRVDAEQAKHLRAHFEAARCLYNALLGEAISRLGRMRADPRWQQARMIPKTCKQERHALFSQLRQEYGFSDYALQKSATRANTAWLADHLDANTAQKLATRAYQAANRVCLGKAKNAQLQRLAAPSPKFPPARPSCRNTVMAVDDMSRSRSRNAGISARVALARYSETCIRLFLSPILI
jgi:hypothetical protein